MALHLEQMSQLRALPPPRRSGPSIDLICLLLSVLLHVVLALRGRDLAADLPTREGSRAPYASTVSVTVPDVEDSDVPLVEVEVRQPELDGQIVEVAPPDEERVPHDSAYLSEFDITVPEETRSERFQINPDVLAPTFSAESKLKSERVEDLDALEPADGARIGRNVESRFDPARDGRLAHLPSPFAATNREGEGGPVAGSPEDSLLAGAPQNDLLREKVGAATQLNTKEYLYASYLKRIRRLVNFYWQQNLDNLPGSVRLANPSYTTGVEAILDGDGSLEIVTVVASSGSPELDDAVVRAFHIAGPFPHPPEGLIEKDGRVYLPSMGFTVQLGTARAMYQGVDPRSGVQFPGILKSPR